MYSKRVVKEGLLETASDRKRETRHRGVFGSDQTDTGCYRVWIWQPKVGVRMEWDEDEAEGSRIPEWHYVALWARERETNWMCGNRR